MSGAEITERGEPDIAPNVFRQRDAGFPRQGLQLGEVADLSRGCDRIVPDHSTEDHETAVDHVRNLQGHLQFSEIDLNGPAPSS